MGRTAHDNALIIWYNICVSFRVGETIHSSRRKNSGKGYRTMTRGIAFTAQRSISQLRLILPLYPVKSIIQKTKRSLSFFRDGLRLFARYYERRRMGAIVHMGACSPICMYYGQTIARQRDMSMKRSGMRMAPHLTVFRPECGVVSCE